MWKGNTILGLLEGLWRWTWPVDSRNGVTSCKRGNRRLLDKVFELKPIKRGGKIPFQQPKAFTWILKANVFSTCEQQQQLYHCSYFPKLLGMVHTGVEICKMNLEMSRLVEQPWLQLICCAVCLPHSCNFRWWKEVRDGSKCWLVCHHWTLEIEFNKRVIFVNYQTSKLQCNY